MFKHLSRLLLIVALCVPWATQAQGLSNYGFETGVDSTKWVDMTSATQILTPTGSPGNDGLASSVQSIGFSFPFGTSTYTQYSVNTDGNLRLGSTVTGTGSYSTPFSSSNANQNNPKINAFGCDGYGVTGTHYVKALLNETNDDTMLVVEFCTGTYSTATRNELYKWQIQLHSNGNIDIVFPDSSGIPATAPAVAHMCGMCESSTDGWIISSNTNTASHFTNGTTITNVSGTWFDANRYYSFIHPNNISCPGPFNIAVNASQTEASFTWTAAGTESSWEVMVNGNSTVVTSAAHTEYNLTPNTPYTFAVRAICGAGDSSTWNYFSFRTACAPISQLPYSNDFEEDPAYSTTPYADAFPYCWTRINDATGTYNYYPYIYANSTYAHSGGAGMYWYHTTTNTYANNQYAVLPPIDLSVYDISDLTLSFYAKTTSASYHPQPIVGVMSDPTDTTTFTPVHTFTATDITTSWELYDVSFSQYTGTGAYIAIKWPRTSSACYLALDDIYLTDEWCDIPGDATASAGLDEVTVSWGRNGGNSFTVYLGTDTVVNVADTFYTFQNLVSNTLYNYGVAKECSDGISMYVNGSIRTLCGYIDSLPYSYGFEDMATGSSSVRPDIPCWTHLNNATQYFGYPYVSSTTPHSGARNLYWYASTTAGTYGDYQIAVLPGVDTNIHPINTLQLTFWARPSSTSYSPVFQVGVMTDPNDASTFQVVEQVDVENVTTWQEFTVMLGGFTGSGNFVALRVLRPTSSSSWYAYTDDITLELMPNCPPVVNMQTEEVSSNSAVLTWQSISESANSYNVYYSTQPGFSIDTCTTVETVYDTFAVLSGLENYTEYYWTVVANCGSELSPVPAQQSFRTLMDCGEGYVNILDTIGQGTSSGYTYFAYNYTSYPYGYTANIYTAEELGEMGLLAGANINSISVHAGATACTINDFKVYMAETTIDQFSGASDTSLINAITLTQVYNGSLTTTSTEWVDIPLSAPFQYSGTSNLLIIYERTSAPTASGNFYYGSTSPDYHTLYGYRSSATANRTATRAQYRVNLAFNMCAEVPECPRPTDVAITTLGDSSVTINWVSGASSFEYVIGANGFDPDGSNVSTTIVNDTFVTIQPLTPNTEYDFYVRTICGGDVSEWSIVTSFRTACNAMPLPFTEDFESYGSGSTIALNSCWVKGTSSSTAYPYPYSTNAVNGSRSLYFYGYQPSSASTTAIYSYAALPMMAAPVDTLQVSFSMRRYSSVTDYYTSRLLVGVMTDPADISTFVGVDTIDLKNEPALSVHNFEVNLDSYTGTGKYIAFYDAVPPLYNGSTYSYSYVYLDDITVDYIPSCRRILDITFDGSTENSASFHWVNPNVNSGNGYEVEYGPEGYTPGTGTMFTTIDTFFTFTGLTASTGYDFYVRTLCSATESSPWSFATNFRTVCGIYPVPFFEDFESYGSGSTYTIDPCWSKGTSSTTAYPYPYSTNAVSGERSLYFYGYLPSSTSTTPVYSYVALPEFTVSVDSLELSFKVRRYATTTDYYTTRLLVGVMTDPTDISTFVGIDTIDLKNEPASSIHDVVVEFSSYTGTGKHIAIYDAVPPLYGTSTYTYSYAYVDDISVNIASPCGRPFNLQGDVTSNSITLDWTDTVGANQWQIEYGPSGFELGQGTTVNVTQHPYTITGLTPSTAYDVYVRSFCPSGAMGGTNSSIYTYITSQVPATVPYLYTFENAAEWANWQTASNNTVSWYRGTAEAAEGQYGLYVSADGGQTCNSLHSTITNAVVYRDIDFGATESSFEVSFLAKAAGVNDGNYEGIHVMLVDPAVPVASSSTALTSPWGTITTVHVVRDTNWGLKTLLFDNVSGVKRLVFYWFTSTTASHPVWEGAGAIDSIAIVEQSCVRPMNTTVTNVGADFVSLTWDGPATDNYMVRLREVNGTVNMDTPVTGTSTTITGLQSMTHYYVWVYRQCGPDNYSYSAPRIEFSTTCVEFAAVDTLWEDFDSYTAVSYSTAGGVLPDCWDGYTNGTSASYMPHVTDGATYSYSITGNPITLTSGSGATYGDTKIVRLPKFVEPVNTLTMSYWYCTESSSSGTLYVGYMTGFDYENDFVPLVTHPASTASLHSGNGVQPAGTGVYDTVTFDSVPSNALFIAFKWYHNSTYYSVCIDNVQVTSTGNYCAAPTVLPASNVTYEGATLNWSSGATDFEVAVKAVSETTWPEAVAVSNATNYTVAGLQPATNYMFRVRAICDATEELISDWGVGTFTTDSLPCFAPSNVEVDAQGLQAEVGWTSNGDETQWVVRVYNSTFDQEYTANANPYTVTGLTANVTYNVTVSSLCGNGAAQSEWTEPVSFTTVPCDPVTNVQVSDITTTTANVSWTAGANNTGSWKVDWNYHGASVGSSGSVTVNTTSAQLTGLTAGAEYDVSVSAICAAGYESNYTTQTFSTTVGIASVEDGMNLSIYPNPATGNTTITLSGVNGNVTLSVIDMSGRTVKTTTMECSGDCQQVIDVDNLAAGAYFVRVYGDNVNTVKKLIVK